MVSRNRVVRPSFIIRPSRVADLIVNNDKPFGHVLYWYVHVDNKKNITY